MVNASLPLNSDLILKHDNRRLDCVKSTIIDNREYVNCELFSDTGHRVFNSPHPTVMLGQNNRGLNFRSHSTYKSPFNVYFQ